MSTKFTKFYTNGCEKRMGVKNWITNCCVIFGGPCRYIQYKQKLNLVSLFSSCPSLLERGRKGKGGGGGGAK